MKKFLSLVLLVVLMVCMTACGEGVEKEVTDSNGETTTIQDTTFGLNETAVFDNLKITATDLKESNGVEYFEASEGNVYVGVKFEIENISDEDQSISSIMMFSSYVDDTASDYSISALMAFDENGNTLDGTLAPGKKMSGYYAVETSKDWETLEIVVKPDMIDDTKASFIFNK